MNKKKIISLSLALVLSLGAMSACSKETGAEVVSETVVVDTSQIKNFQTYEEIPEVREYAPYEHVFFERYYNYLNLRGGTIEIPEGYELLDIKYYNEKFGYGSQTNYADIWFVNNETVEVSPVYNDTFNTYDYSQPGSVIVKNDSNFVTDDKKIK